MNIDFLKILISFTCGIASMFFFEYPALTTALQGLNDKNAAIERLENMVKDCKP